MHQINAEDRYIIYKMKKSTINKGQLAIKDFEHLINILYVFLGYPTYVLGNAFEIFAFKLNSSLMRTL